jgi:S-adenosylmethionine:tRNA ribosyltransferase-isomerase
VDRAKGEISEIVFRELADFLQEGDSLVFNDTKVIPARLIGKKPSGAKIEVFLLEKECGSIWSALVKPGKKAPPGTTIAFSDTFECAVLEDVADGVKKIEFSFDGDFEPHLLKHGKMPLPPYIRRDSSLQDSSCYQTVFAKNTGAVAAPTAGLHFTPEVLESLSAKGVLQTHITLHVGLGTFRPVQTEDIRKHVMHKERYEITPEAAAQLNARVKDRRQICVGTTCCRTLEFAVDRAGVIQPGIGSADIFIYPGYRFKYVNSLLTNFHLPGSTLLMLVSAFAGHELTREAYERAVKERYRFFSYGDAMLIL